MLEQHRDVQNAAEGMLTELKSRFDTDTLYHTINAISKVAGTSYLATLTLLEASSKFNLEQRRH